MAFGHQKMHKEDFIEEISNLIQNFFLYQRLYCLLHIMYNGWWWCYCEEKKEAWKK